MTFSRLRAGLVATFAVVSLMVGAQGAHAQATCPEPALGDLPARGVEKDLVRFELTGLTPGSEYLVKVNGRERKSGIADTDKVSRRFRMPGFGDSNRRVRVEVVVAHDACENSPWKLEEKMTYRPAPEPQAPAAQPDPAPQSTPAPQSDPAPTPSPDPPGAPAPPAAPKLDSTPAPQPAIPKSPPVKPAQPALPTPAPAITAPPLDGKAWVTPIDPNQRGEDEPLRINKGLLARTDQPSEIANSTAALFGLAGILLFMAGGGAMAWTRFRRYDDDRLAEVENPDGSLPKHLDPKAKDIAGEEAAVESGKRKRWLPLPVALPRLRRKERHGPAAPGAPAVAAATAGAKAGGDAQRLGQTDGDEPARKRRLPRLRRGGRRIKQGYLAGFTEAEAAAMSRKELRKLKGKYREEQALIRYRKRKATLPTVDPTAPGGRPATAAEPDVKPEQTASGPRRIADADREAGSPPTPAVPAPGAKGAPQNGTPPAATPPVAPASKPAPPPNGQPPAHRSHREQVESELQRILAEAGLGTKVDGILADAKQEAQRQGVPIDSEMMLKALCDDTNGSAKLSDSARGQLESRFKRIAAEEHGDDTPSPGSGPPRG